MKKQKDSPRLGTHNLQLLVELADKEKPFKDPELLKKFIPSKKVRTSDVLPVILKAKKTAKFQAKVGEIVKEIYSVNPESRIKEAEEINANRERRMAKYGHY